MPLARTFIPYLLSDASTAKNLGIILLPDLCRTFDTSYVNARSIPLCGRPGKQFFLFLKFRLSRSLADCRLRKFKGIISYSYGSITSQSAIRNGVWARTLQCGNQKLAAKRIEGRGPRAEGRKRTPA